MNRITKQIIEYLISKLRTTNIDNIRKIRFIKPINSNIITFYFETFNKKLVPIMEVDVINDIDIIISDVAEYISKKISLPRTLEIFKRLYKRRSISYDYMSDGSYGNLYIYTAENTYNILLYDASPSQSDYSYDRKTEGFILITPSKEDIHKIEEE